jgi:hypothetical protein
MLESFLPVFLVIGIIAALLIGLTLLGIATGKVH